MPKPRLSHQAWLSAFPHLTYEEFEAAINRLTQRNHQHDHKHNDWVSTDIVTANGIAYLSIAKPLLSGTAPTPKHDETDDEVEEDDDNEAFRRPMQSQPISHYDIILSPTYRVPVLYVSISDMQQRYPPTMATLTEHLIPPRFQAETESVGVIGGITITVSPTLSSTRWASE
jgi:ubiquitin-like-conjugating enzyme ATG10